MSFPLKEVASEYSLSETAVRNWSKKKAPINVVEGNPTNYMRISASLIF